MPSDLGTISQVIAGQYHTCAVKTDGTVVCWGFSSFMSIVPDGLNLVTQLSTTTHHTCARKSDATMVCWGFDSYGESEVPRELTSVAQVSVGDRDTCALNTDGTVSCWGRDDYGQTDVPAGLASVSQISAGFYHTCALKTDGTVVCWGNNGAGQASVPSNLTSVSRVTAGASHTCALKTDGTVVCWGDNSQGQATVPTDLYLSLQPQKITFTSSPPSPAVVGASYTVVASGGGSPNLVLFSIPATGSTCSISGSVVTLLQIGSCTIAADQAGGSGYLPAPQETQTFTVVASQSIQFTSAAPNPAVVGTTYTVSAQGGPSGNPVTFSSLSETICTVSESTVSLIHSGTCLVAADQAGGNGYLAAAQASQSFSVVDPQPQSILFTSTPPNPPIVDGAYTVTASGGGSGNPVTFTSLTPGTCGVSGAMVSFTARGTCTIAANQTGNAIYLPAPQVTQSVVIDTRPLANAGSAQIGSEGSAVTFSGSGSSDAGGDALTYNWDFGDGTTQNTSTASVQHIYNDNGTYVVTLNVTDARGATSSPATTSATIANVRPTATFAPTSPAPEGPMTISLTSPQDAAGDLLTLQYAFDCGDGLGLRAFGSSPSVTCNVPDNGTLTVHAQVKDKDGGISPLYAATVTMINVAPTVTMISAPTTGTVGADYTIQYRFSDPGTRDSPWYYQTNWGDGKKLALYMATTQGQTITQTNRFNSPGTYTITVKVIDKDGASGTRTFQVTIR